MRISIIGAGNMGMAIACGLAKDKKIELKVSNPTKGKLETLKRILPGISITTDNCEAATWGDIIILAVKPWVMQTVVSEIKTCLNSDKQLVSIAAGIGTEKILSWLDDTCMPVYYVIPNTAISIGKSMTFIAHSNAEESELAEVVSLFGKMGRVMLVEEKKIPACMALASCGIAYAMRYVRANMEGAIELGLKPAKALEIIEQTIVGAAKLLEKSGNHPEAEIDKVTTPGGLTIKGLNALEENGFTTAVIKALKASV